MKLAVQSLFGIGLSSLGSTYNYCLSLSLQNKMLFLKLAQIVWAINTPGFFDFFDQFFPEYSRTVGIWLFFYQFIRLWIGGSNHPNINWYKIFFALHPKPPYVSYLETSAKLKYCRHFERNEVKWKICIFQNISSLTRFLAALEMALNLILQISIAI